MASSAGAPVAGQLPAGFQRLGRVLILRLPENLRPYFRAIGEAWCSELGVRSVLRRAGETGGELRIPHLELIAGDETVTEVVEYGIRYRFDAQQVLFARGNRTERHRMGTVTRPGEVVADLFAGIGYFSLPAGVTGKAARVWAVEKNPVSYGYLVANVRLNHVETRVECVLGDNREVEVPAAAFDRVFLGYLPSAVPWVPSALDLLRPRGGTLHVHLLVGHREGLAAAEAQVCRIAEREGASIERVSGRVVKAFGPGREHVVVDLTARPVPGRRR